MPLQLEKKCHVCKAIKRDAKLAQRIYDSRFYTGTGEAVLTISLDTGLNYRGLLNHMKTHQTLDSDGLVTAKLNRIAKKQAGEVIRKQVRTMDARQEIIDRTYAKLIAGEYEDEMGLSHLLTALKDADNRELKMGDQGIDFMRLMATMRSGELAQGIQKPEERDLFDPWSSDGEYGTWAEAAEEPPVA